MKASQIFQPGWMMFGLHDLRPSKHTYEQTDYHSLPRLPKLDPGLEWLLPLPPKIEEEMRHFRPDEEFRNSYISKREQVMAQARTLNFELGTARIVRPPHDLV